MLTEQADELRTHGEVVTLASLADCMREAADTIDSLQDALRRACQFIAGYGSCPYDTFDLYEPWEESCYQKCSADIDRAECWQRYFENGDDSR